MGRGKGRVEALMGSRNTGVREQRGDGMTGRARGAWGWDPAGDMRMAQQVTHESWVRSMGARGSPAPVPWEETICKPPARRQPSSPTWTGKVLSGSL